MDGNLEAFIDNKVYEIGGDLGCTLAYTAEHYLSDEDNNPRYNIYTTEVYVTEIANKFGVLTLKTPVLLFEVASCEDFEEVDATINYSGFNAERAAQEFFNSMGEE